MRKIELEMLKAIKQGTNKCLSNTTVDHVFYGYSSNTTIVRLHGHNIFTQESTLGSIELTINMCGYPTVTTRSRLNAILQCHNMGVCQRKGKQYLVDNLRGDLTFTELDCNAPYTIILLKD